MGHRWTPLERLCLSHLLLLALAWGLAELLGERSLPTTLLAYTPPLLFMWPAPLLLLAALFQPRSAALPLVLLACLAALAFGGLSLHRPILGPGLRLLSYNVARGGLGTPARLAADIRAADPDVVALQEVNGLKAPVDDPSLLTDLAPLLPGYQLVRAREVAVFSRLPVEDSRIVSVPDNRALLEVRVRWQGRTVRVVDAHFATVKFSGMRDGSLGRTVAWRAEELGALLVVAGQSGGPLILTGDFNTPARGRDYRTLDHLYPDAFERAGLGFGWSFPATFPLWRIDHVFTRGLTPLRAELRPAGGSDHRALLVVLR